MISSTMMRRPLGFVLLAACAPSAPSVAAQTQTGIGTYTYQLAPAARQDPAADLARYVRDLSSNPKSLVALKGAGAAALKLGDAEAAGGFFARAEEVSPRDGEVKAGIASVLALMGEADAALRLFAEASALGVPDRDLAAYRGLARDLKGDQAAAQKDYTLAIRTLADAPEVERRLALSQAISGEKLKALNTIEEQLRRQDKAAWRTRAFILALTGDYAGATQAVKIAVPAQAAAFAPFLARLSELNPAEKAAAVHLGYLPVTFQNLRTSEAVPAPASPPVQTASAQPQPQPQPPIVSQPVQTQPVRTKPVQSQPGPAASTPSPRPVVASLSAAPTGGPEPLRFADVAELVQDLPAPVQAQVAPVKAATKKPEPKAEPVKAAAKKAESKKTDPAKTHPARSWVQLASGANQAALPGEYKKIKAKAEKLLASRPAYFVKAGATNRLLVGPFKTAKEAQTFVNDLAKDKVNGFAWTSAAGQEIGKLPAK